MEKWLFYLGILLVLVGVTLGGLAILELLFESGIVSRPPGVPAAALTLAGAVILRNSQKKNTSK